MAEEYSRRKQKNPKQKKPPYFIMIIFSCIHMIGLGFLLFVFIQSDSKFEKQLNTIERRVGQLDHSETSVTPTKSTIPKTGQPSQTSTTSESTVSSESTSSEISTSPSEPSQTTQSESSVTTTRADSYVIQAGDTLSLIAEKNNLTLQELMTKNGLSDTTVYVGQVLSLR